VDLAFVQLAVLVFTAHLWLPTLSAIVREVWTTAHRMEDAGEASAPGNAARQSGVRNEFGIRPKRAARWPSEEPAIEVGRVRNPAWQIGRTPRPSPRSGGFARRTRGLGGDDRTRGWRGGFGRRGV
jgi:hypothetical protein